MSVLEFLAKLFFGNLTQEGLIFKIFGTMGTDGKLEVANSLPIFLIAFAWMITSYLIGSINFSILISKLAFNDDIRKYGSQNAGSTNMNRVYGAKLGLFTLLGDVSKGLVTVLLAKLFFGNNVAAFCGFCCMLGHCFPVYYRFKGGKGVATAGGVILALEPIAGILTLLVFAVVTLGMHFVSLGSMMAGFFYPIFLSNVYKIVFNKPPTALMMISAVAMAILLIARHHGNIKRLLNGTENKFYLKKKKKDAAPAESAEAPRSLHHIDDEEE